MVPAPAGNEAEAAIGRMLDRELAWLAHELNQPLAAITMFVRGAQLRLRTGALSEGELDGVLESIVVETWRAAAVVRDLRTRGRQS